MKKANRFHLETFVFYIQLALLMMLSYFSDGQQPGYTKTPAVGIHFETLNFKKTDSFYASGKAVQPGLGISYQNNISAHIVYSVTLSGAFIEQAQKNEGKDLFLEGGGVIRANCFKQNKLFNPYVSAGVGISKFRNDYNFTLPAGIGCQVNLTSNVLLLFNSLYRFTITDNQYNHWVTSVGIAGVINRKKITKVKQVPLPVAAATINPVDTDGDGIMDSEDSCPLIVGVIKYHGCPLPDQESTDISNEIKQQIRIAATKIFFETGSFKLLQQSSSPLNEVVQILKDNPRIQLIIDGHTDNAGTPAGNQVLSENRARTVFTYLIDAGISANRLQYRGFGQDKPIADNSTIEGMAKNRRVELKVF